MAVNPKKDALTSSDLAGAIPEDFVGAVNKNAAKADDELETVPFNGRDVRLQPGNKRSEDVVANRANFAAGDKLLLSPRSGYGLTDAVVEKVGKSNLQFRGWRNTVPILKLSGGLRIRGNMVSVIKGLSSNAKFAPGDVAYCRAFACNARVMSVGTTKSGICNYKVALYDAKGVSTGEAVCSESDLVRRSVRGLKLTGLASGASRACDVAATILEKMVQRNKVDLPLAKKVLRLTQRDFPDARVSVAAAKLNENPPALLSAAKILRAEANRLRAQGKTVKAQRDEDNASYIAGQIIQASNFLNGAYADDPADAQKRNPLLRKAAQQLVRIATEVPPNMKPMLSEWVREINTAATQSGDERERTLSSVQDRMGRVSRPLRQQGKFPKSMKGIFDNPTPQDAAETYKMFLNTWERMTQGMESRGQDPRENAMHWKNVISGDRLYSRVPEAARVYQLLLNAQRASDVPPAFKLIKQSLAILRTIVRKLESGSGFRSMKAMRAAVKRAPAEALPLIAPLHSKLLMIYRRFIGDPEGASLGSLPALAAQWKSAGNKLPDEEQSGVALIVRDLISAYRSFTKEQVKNTAYFLAMALGTANKMVGGSANVPIPAHLRAVKAEVTRKVVLNNARQRFLSNYKFKVNDAEYEKPNPVWQGGNRLPALLSAADVTSKVNEYIFANSGARYGKLIAMDMNAYASFITKIAANQGSALGIHHLFGDKPGGFANADTIVRIGANAWNEYSTKFNASIQNKPA